MSRRRFLALPANTAIADITTKEGSLVERIKVDLRTGQMSYAD